MAAFVVSVQVVGINSPKTRAEERTVSMIESVREAILQEKENQGLSCIQGDVRVDGYTNFVFVNRSGNVQHQRTINKALRRIIRDCNDESFENQKGNNQMFFQSLAVIL